MRQELVEVKNELGRGGALCKEFNRVKMRDDQNWRIEMFYALEAMEKSKALQDCEPSSIGRCIIDVGTMGLSLSPAKKEAYLIPYQIKVGPNKRIYRAELSISYMGMEQIAYRTGFVELIQTNVVRAGDKWKLWADEDGRHIEHVEGPERGSVLLAYCIVKLSSGRTYIETMTKEELLEVRKAATKKNGDKIPFTWTGPFRVEMYKKSVLRRAWKNLPRSENPRLLAMMEAVDRADKIEFKREDENVVREDPFIDGDHLSELVEMMADAEVPKKKYGAILAGLAKSMGYPGGIRSLPKSEFEAARGELLKVVERFRKWQQSQTSPQSGSEQGDTTQQAEAT